MSKLSYILNGMLIGVCEIIDGLCLIASLGHWQPYLSMKTTAWITLRRILKEK